MSQKVMVMREHREIEFENDRSEDDEMPPLKDNSDENVEYPVKEKSLIIRYVLNFYIKKDDVEQEMKNIFHTRYRFNNKVYNMIIDNESCANIAYYNCYGP